MHKKSVLSLFAIAADNLVALLLALAVLQVSSPHIGTELKSLHAHQLSAALWSCCLENPTNAIASENPISGQPVH